MGVRAVHRGREALVPLGADGLRPPEPPDPIRELAVPLSLAEMAPEGKAVHGEEVGGADTPRLGARDSGEGGVLGGDTVPPSPPLVTDTVIDVCTSP